jgi:glycosyltransferase involved in cell wall biosynthesis
MAPAKRLYCRVHRRYYINGRFLTQKATGVQRFAGEIIKSLDDMIGRGDIDPDQSSFELLTPPEHVRSLDVKHIAIRRVGILSGHRWEQLMLPSRTRDGFLLNLCNTGPLFKHNQLATIHDAGILVRPHDYRLGFRFWYRPMTKRLGKNSRLIITISQFSRQELNRHFGIPLDKIHVVSLSGEHMLAAPPDDTILDDTELEERRYLLAVNAMNTRKNLRAVVEAIKLMRPVDFKVVVTGSNNDRVFRKEKLVLTEEFFRVGHVSDSRLRSLYSHASALIYPSLYEGFGLPSLEAMTCGCPALVSDIPAHRETCGDAAYYCDPNNGSDIAEKIKDIMTDSALRNELISKGKARADQFTWQNTAAELFRHLKSS